MSTATGAFDGTSYRQRVLATLRKSPTLDLADPFFVTDLPVDVDDEQFIQARLDALVSFWRKEKSPNYKQLSLELARRRAELDEVLLDPAARRRAAASVRANRALMAADRYSALDSLADKLIVRYGGVPRSRMAKLATLARSKGLDDAAFAAWASRHRIVEDGPVHAEPLSATVRTQIRDALDELGRLTGDVGRTATLWTLLELAPSAGTTEIASSHALLHEANQRRQHDRQQTVTADLLTYAKQHLLTGDRGRYAASLAEDAKDRLHDSVAETAIVDGSLTAADFEACVRKAMGFGYGLSTEQVRTAVRELATSLGVSLATAPAVDYVVCINCREPQTAGESPDLSVDCRYCGERLYQPCPGCRRPAEAAAVACPHCGVSFRAVRAAEERMSAARAALAEGKPTQAKTALVGARPAVAGLAADLDALADSIELRLTGAAGEWRAIERDIASKRLFNAIDRLSRLTSIAADVAGPGEVSASDRLAELAGRKASVQAEVAAARALPDELKEAALERIMTVASDCAEALDLLDRIPLAPPTELVASPSADSVALNWRASPAPAQVLYRVSRTVVSAGGVPTTSAVGTTAGVAFEDAGVPGGAVVSHEVVATAGRRISVPLTGEPALVVRDVTRLSANTGPDGVMLTWTLPLAAGTVIVERTVDPESGINAPLRRAHAQGSSYHDPGVQPGVGHTYLVYAEYRTADGRSVRTAGQQVTARLTPRPRAVTDLWAITGAEGHTTLGWASPPAGEVRIFAADGPLAVSDTDVRLSDMARRGRFVGGGRRRTVDTVASGQITYTPVTVDGDRAVVGAAVPHLTVPTPRDLRVDDRGEALFVQFGLPMGVTEAVVLSRRDAAPTGPGDLHTEQIKVTNTRLTLTGGVEIAAPRDGRSWFIAVHSATRDASGSLLVAPTGVHTQARAATPVHATYEVRRSGSQRRGVVVEVNADGPLPDLELVAKPGGVPASARDGQVVGHVAGGQQAARLEFGQGDLPLPAGLRLFPTGRGPRPLELKGPSDDDLLVDG